MTDQASAAESIDIKVSHIVHVTLERIQWEYMTSIDYYVMVGTACIGVVGLVGNYWTASRAREGDTLAVRKLEMRKFDTRHRAAQALVNLVAKSHPSVIFGQ